MEIRPKINYSSDFDAKIFHGLEALIVLQEDSFKNQWAMLFENSISSSVFQSSSFVLSWYQINKEEFYPIVLIAYSSDKLVGLLTLAQKIDKKTGAKSSRLEGAGSSYAIYQTWLVLPEYQNIFWEVGILGIFKKFPNTYINLKSLPPSHKFDSLKGSPTFKKMTVFETFQNPILDYEKDDFQEVFKKRHFRSKFNRINRAGEVKFERVNSKEDLQEALNCISTYHDLRQGAAFNKIPFGNDLTPKKLFLELFANDLLHVSLLWFNKEIIGAVIIIKDTKTAHLAGLITYSPRHGKFSPGLVHLYYLGLLLNEEGFNNLKLSPGYDSYKERFCNSHEDIFELLISPDFFEKTKRKLRVKLRQGYLKRGIRPMNVEVFLNKNMSKLKNRLVNFSRNFKISKPISSESINDWANVVLSKDSLSNLNYRKDNLDDLLLVEEYDFNVSRWEFLEDTLKRLEDSQNFTVLVDNGKLLACIWYKIDSDSPIFENNRIPDLEILKIYVSKVLNLNDLKKNNTTVLN